MTSSANVPVEITDPCPELVALIATLSVLLVSTENRKRRRSKAAQAAYDRTLIAVVAAIATNALAEVPPHEGEPISMADHSYVGGPFSVKAMRPIMEGLDALGFVVRKNGYHDRDNPEKSFCTSFRHTWEFRDFILEHGLSASQTVFPPVDAIHLNDPDSEYAIPADIAKSASIVERYNQFISAVEITLPAWAWTNLEKRNRASGGGEERRYNQGFNSKKIYFRRVFSKTYGRCGRLYGAWWVNTPGVVRRQMRLNGEEVVELDYEAIHPTMIAAEKRLNYVFKPYETKGFPSRKAAKEMFNRLLNSSKPVKYDGRKDKKVYGSSDKFYECRDIMLAELQPISDALQCDYGARLQKLDSELALRVIERFMDAEIPVCPVHDSFIVPVSRRQDAERIMKEEFRDMFSWEIQISTK